MSTEPHKRRWFQFRLRTLLFFITILCLACAWLGVQIKWMRDRDAALLEMEMWNQSRSGHARAPGYAIGYGRIGPGYVSQGLSGMPPPPPWPISIFQKKGVAAIVISVDSSPEAETYVEKIRRLFPESQVVVKKR